LGDFETAGLPEGADMTSTVSYTVGTTAFGSDTAVKLAFNGGGLPEEYTLSYTITAGTSDAGGTALAGAVNDDETLAAAGITASYDTSTNALVFSNSRGENFSVSQAGDRLNLLGMGAFRLGENGYVNDTEVKIGTFEAPTDTQKTQLSFSFNGGTSVDVDVTWSGVTTAAGAVTAIQSALDAASALDGAGMTASTSGGELYISSSNGTKFRLQVSADHASADFGNTAFGTTETAFTAPTLGGDLVNTHVIGGAYTIDPLSFSNINYASESQVIKLSMGDDVQNITLNNGNSRSIDEAISTINSAIQSGLADKLKGITAVKVVESGAEKIQFVGSTGPYKLEITGDNDTSQGLADATKIYDAEAQDGIGVSASIATKQNAEAAVTALSRAVSALGDAQAVVGKGQNQFNFAVSLASTQLTNLAASESRIRDADLAQEAANLTRAQILTQAGVAALAQANSAPQAVLSLLHG
jgi:flagellin